MLYWLQVNPLSSSKSKNQVVHEQKFTDLLSSTWQVSVERIVLDLESVMRGPGSIPTGGNIFHLNFLFSRSKASASNIDIIAILVHFEKKL